MGLDIVPILKVEVEDDPGFHLRLVIFVASSALAYMIWVADTWFYVTISTTLVSLVWGGLGSFVDS
jgi:hypothetical protein